MTDDEFEEIPDEEEPESLKRKWDREAGKKAGDKECPHCGNPVQADSFYSLVVR